MSTGFKCLWKAGLLSCALLAHAALYGAERRLGAPDLQINAGATNVMNITLDALGDENGLAFSVCFDNRELKLVGIHHGPALTQITPAPQVIAEEAEGQLGLRIRMDLSSGQTFPGGLQLLLQLVFTTAATHSTGITTVTFCDTPVPREIWDVAGNSLVTTYDEADVTVNPPCSYRLGMRGAVHTAATTTNSVPLTTGLDCIWSVANTNEWVTILSPLQNTNSSTIRYAISANATAISRQAVITIGEQEFTITQDGLPCTWALDPSQTSYSADASTGVIAVSTVPGCTWAVWNTNEWISIVSNLQNTNGGSVNYAVAANTTALRRTAVLGIGERQFTITQEGADCVWAAGPQQTNHPAAASTGFVAVTTLTGCTWSVTNTNSWVTLLSGLQNTNSGVVSYAIAGNPTMFPRLAAITVAGQEITISQEGAACAWTLEIAQTNHPAEASTGLVAVTAVTGCTWSTSNTNDWISILSDLPSTNSGTVRYAVEANTTALPRTGVLTIAGKEFVVTQEGLACTWAVDFQRTNHPWQMSTGTAVVTTITGCTWSVSNTNDWISISTDLQNTNSGTVHYAVAANNAALPRTGTVVVAGQEFAIIQDGSPCTWAIAFPSTNHPAGMSTGLVAVTTVTGCTWAASNTNDWISILSDLENTNDGTVTYVVAENATAIPRSASISIAGQEFTITQEGMACTWKLALAQTNHPPEISTGEVAVTTVPGCTWSAANTNEWISILSSAENTNSGTVSYAVAANGTSIPRSATITIAGQDFLITQEGLPCTWTLASSQAEHPSEMSTGAVALTTVTGCTWTISNTNGWISILSDLQNTNSGTVRYAVAENATAIGRTAVIAIAGQAFAISQAGKICTWELAFTQTNHPSELSTGAVAMTTVAGCTWGVVNTNEWISILTDTQNTNSGTVRYTVAENPTAISRLGALTIAGQEFTVAQAGAVCTWTLGFSETNYSAQATTGVVAVTTVPGCTWSVSSTNQWISILSDFQNTNSGAVVYEVLPNPTAAPRTGSVMIAGQPLLITQDGLPCTYTLSTNATFHIADGGPGSVAVTTITGCQWGVSTTNEWISILSNQQNTNDGLVAYAVAPNPTAIPRTGFIAIGGHHLTVRQDGLPCTPALQASNAVHRAVEENGLVGVITASGCVWTIENTNEWLKFPTGTTGVGTAHAGYTALANTNAGSRTATIAIAGIPWTITQMGMACTYRVSPVNRTHGNGANSNSFSVTGGGSCEWAVLNTNAWITILSNASGAGPLTVGYAVARNTSPALRSGVINVAGETLQITQWGTACGFAFNSPTRAHGYAAESGSVALNASSGTCAWIIENTNSWVTITSATTGTGATTIFYSLSPNPTGQPRSATLTVGTAQFLISQAGAPCSFSLSETSGAHSYSSATGLIRVTTGPGCAWEATTTNSWITFTSVATVTNSGTVTYAVAANPTGLQRVGAIRAGGQVFTVTQAGAPCEFALDRTTANHGFGSETGTVGVITLPGCPWTVVNTNTWVVITAPSDSAGPMAVAYALTANPASTPRTAALIVAGKEFTITQAGAPCTYTLATNAVFHGHAAESGNVALITPGGCEWSVANSNSWISIVTASGSSGAAIEYLVRPNPSVFPRTGFIYIAGQALAVTQAGQPCTYLLSPAEGLHRSGAETGSFQVVAPVGCDWNVGTLTPWITITSPTNGTAAGVVTYRLATNGPSLRRGEISVAGSRFTVQQAGTSRLVRAVDTTIGRDQTNRVIIALEATGIENAVSFSVCFDTNQLAFVGAVRGSAATNLGATLGLNAGAATLSQGRVGVTLSLDFSSGQAFRPGSNAIVELSFRALPGLSFASTSLGLCDSPIRREISDIDFNSLAATYVDGAVEIAGTCTYGLSTNPGAIDARGATVQLAVTAHRACPWTAITSETWISIDHVSASAGNGTVTYTVAPNPTAFSRSGSITAGGVTHAVVQEGTPCSYALWPSNATHGFTTQTGTVAVAAITGCNWTVLNTNAWITILTETNGSANGEVRYVVQPNPAGVPRVASVLIAGQIFTINQAGAPCEVVLSPTNRTHGFSIQTATIAVTSPAGCAWNVETTNAWIIINGTTNGTGSGTVSYTITYNPVGVNRTGAVFVAGAPVIIRQSANPCPVVLGPSGRSHGPDRESGSFTVTPSSSCAWSVVNTNGWISIPAATNGTDAGTIQYTVDRNPAGIPRSGTISVSGSEFLVTQAAATCFYTLVPTQQAHGPGAESGEVLLSTAGNCTWTVSNTSTWITVTGPLEGAGADFVWYTVSPNPTIAPRAATLFIGYQPYQVTQAGAPCTFVMAPSSTNYGSGTHTGSVAVTTLSGCEWTVSTTAPWITLTTATNFTNNSVVGFRVASNPTALTRTGTINIGDAAFNVTQTGVPCTFALNPANRAHTYNAATNAVSVTAPIGCAWNVVNTNGWITVLTGTDGVGSGTLTYAIAPNPAPFARTGTILIGGQSVTLLQAGSPCTYSLSNRDLDLAASEQIAGVDLTTSTGCTWNLINTNSWIELLGEPTGAGNASIFLLVSANPSGGTRTGQVQIANQLVTIRQLGQPCSLSLSSTSATHQTAAATNDIGVTTLAGCPWNARANASWITLLTGTNYVGSTSVRYAVAENLLAVERTGTISVGSQTFTVTQPGIVCTYAISPTNATLTSGNVTGLVSIASSGGCAWAVQNSNAWIAIKAGGEGTNNGLLRYTAAANPFPTARVGSMVVAGHVFTVTQLGSPCSYSLSATGRLHSSLADTGQVTVVAVAQCAWTINNTNPWVSFVAGTNGAGPSVITYAVEANPTSLDRTAVFTVGDQAYTITQLGAVCTYSLVSTQWVHGGLAETQTVSLVTPMGCTWSVSESVSWITIISGPTYTNSSTVTYAVANNVSGNTRSGTINLGGEAFVVRQAPVDCQFEVGPTNNAHGFESETNVISVTTSNVCPWTASRQQSWITLLSGTSYTGSTNLTYTISPNPSGSPRIGTITVAGQTVTIRQEGLVCTYDIAPRLRGHEFGSETGQVVVTSPTLCSWTVVKTNSWVTLLTASNNVGPGTVRYMLAPNPTASPRTSVLMIAGQPFTVIQNGMPFIVASNKTVLCDASWSFDAPILATNCAFPGGSVVILSTTTNAGCGPTYTARRVWDGTDACGSHIVCTQTVNVATLPPSITCAPDKVVECGTVWTFDAPRAVEYCTGATPILSVVSTITNNTERCGTTYSITRTFQARDACGNITTCSQTVHVVDTKPPVVLAPPDKTVECGSVWEFDTPGAIDSCGGTNLIIQPYTTVTNSTGTCGYSIIRVWEILDACSNRSTSTQIVTAVDTTIPGLAWVPLKTVECGSAWIFDRPRATDNCYGTNVEVTVVATSTNAGACGNTMSATRTWMARDGCGNANFCSQTVQILDSKPPTVACQTNKVVEFGAAWDFDEPSGMDGCHGTNLAVSVVSTVTNRTGFCGNTFSATRLWQLTDACGNSAQCSQMVTVNDTTPPEITCAPSKTINCLGVWDFDAPVALDYPGGELAEITIVSTVTNGSCGNNFSATRTWRATDACGNSSTCSQTVFGRALVSVSGTIFAPTNYPATLTDRRVRGALVVAPINSLTGSDGVYNCIFDAASNVVMAPVPPPNENAAEGITTLDLSLVRRHILSAAPLDSPYKLLASDVDGSGTISTLDLSFMRRLILGVTNRFPVAQWRFIPADFAFTNPGSPWFAPANRTYPGIASDISGQDFVAIKLGDVNHSWGSTAGASAKRLGNERAAVTLQVESNRTMGARSVVVPIRVQGFRRVTSLQATLKWDPAVLRYAGTEQFGVAGLGAANFGSVSTDTGLLTFSWYDPTAAGAALADGAVLFALRFDVIGSPGATTAVALRDSIAAREAGVNFAPATFQSTDGTVAVTPVEPPQVAFEGSPSRPGVTVTTVPGRRYVLEYSNALPGDEWTALPPADGTGGILTLIDPQPSASQRFYRVRIE